jgi:hypothetical protein
VLDHRLYCTFVEIFVRKKVISNSRMLALLAMLG